MKVILYGFLIHIIFFLSVFDIYFKSPILTNIAIQHNHINPPARRLVLFVADGLRADSIFSVMNENLSPHLRSVIEGRGQWGVAHSRVPTESRPGHIALIAGFYEDPSAVFTGWKDNLVEFDSLFNQSYTTYSWGSPDILPMFKKGAMENKVHTTCYDAEDEDFSGQGSTRLNSWVFEKVEEFIRTARNEPLLNSSLRRQGVVFFLHLLGTDVAGHANKPHSRKYKENISVIDAGVKRIENLINEYYDNDNRTAFVYTSDHGMTDWGSHGAGSRSETEVPVVVWGAGAGGPLPQHPPDPRTPPDWRLAHLRRTDVAQADLTPLMAVLVGIPIPVHSVGVLPLDFLSLADSEKAAAILLNARQLTAQLSRKRETVEGDMIPWLYSPFQELTREQELQMLKEIERMSEEGRYNRAIEETQFLIELTHRGLDYYHSYFQGLLLSCVSLSFLGWISWLLCQLVQQTPERREGHSSNIQTTGIERVQFYPDGVFLLLAVFAVFLIYVQSLPLQLYLYCCLPLLLWWAVLRHWRTTSVTTHHLATAVLYVLLLELLVLTFFQRWVISLVVTGVGCWPLTLGGRRRLIPVSLQLVWFTSLIVMAVFPTLPVIGSQTQVEYVILSGGLWLVFGLATLSTRALSSSRLVLLVQLFMLAFATCVILFTSHNFDNEIGLQLFNQIAAWGLLVSSVVVPLTTGCEVPQRFLSIGLGLAVPFLLLCVGHEAFFFLSLFLCLCVWLSVEACLSRVNIMKTKFEETSAVNDVLSAEDFRKGFFFLMFIILSFFGTGNIASVNSFDVSWVRCFLTVFSPFTMMTLILLKTVIPFLLVTCAFRAINIFSEVKAEKMLVIVLVYCDVMGLHFLFSVTTKGSWLEIGTSVSHFVIMEATVLFLAALYSVARLYTGTTIVGRQRSTISGSIAPLWQKTHPD